MGSSLASQRTPKLVQWLVPEIPGPTSSLLGNIEAIFGRLALTKWKLGFSMCCFFYILGLIIYRLYFHPLAKYPGPPIARMTSLHAAYHAWVGDSHLVLYYAHRKYGKFVRFTPNFVSINDAGALQELYSFKANVQKSKFYSVMPPYPNAFDTHTIIDKVQHGRKRRVMSQAFSDAALKGMEENVLTNIRAFVENLGKRDDGAQQPLPRNMANWSNWLTFDIMGDLCFGKAFGMLQRDEWRFWPTLIDQAIHRHAIAGISLKIHSFGLGKLLFPRVAEGQKTFVLHSREQAKERIALGVGHRSDFFEYLMRAKDPQTGVGYTMDELWSESNLLIAAGSHTPSTALVATFFFLANYSDICHRLTTLIRKTFPHDIESIRNDTLLSQPTCRAYLRACLDEAMRMAPPVPTTLPREVLKGGIKLAGEFFPEGVDVATPAFTLYMNEEYFSEPYRYNPDRWILKSGATEKEKITYERAQMAFAPFSLGPRSCIGRGLAYAELTLTLARTVWMYDFIYEGGGRETRLDNYEVVERLGGGSRPVMYRIDDHHAAHGTREGPNIRFLRRKDWKLVVSGEGTLETLKEE